MSNIVDFIFENQKVRTMFLNGEPYFVAKDVCDILEYKNTAKAIQDNCNTKGVTSGYIPTKGGMQKASIINEPNLYRLIARSKMPNAEKFEAWVFEEVLPTIRKTGSYSLLPNQSVFPEIYKHIERAELNKHKIPYTHFAMIGEMAVRVLMPLQTKGFDLLADTLPDGSLGKGFVKYLKEKGKDVSLITKYQHEYPDGRICESNLYPNEFYADLQTFVNEVWLHGLGAKYFQQIPKKLK